MEMLINGKLKKVEQRHEAGVSKQTGFPSPATHYLEPTINLHQELITNSDATFFVRVVGDSLAEFNIMANDVLIIDRSIHPKDNNLALIVDEGEFKIIRIPGCGLREEIMLWGVITYIIHCSR